jgi:hypothetical protein
MRPALVYNYGVCCARRERKCGGMHPPNNTAVTVGEESKLYILWGPSTGASGPTPYHNRGRSLGIDLRAASGSDSIIEALRHLRVTLQRGKCK